MTDSSSAEVQCRARWVFSEEAQCMVAALDRVHVMPVGDSSEHDVHVAHAECWCSPTIEPQPSGIDICTHHALTGPDHDGWVVIGERLP
jgi:hypothetical protein